MKTDRRWLTIREALAWLHKHYGPSRGESYTIRETLNRLMTKGCPTTGVVLRSKLGPGGRRYTCVQWIEEFYAERDKVKQEARQDAADRMHVSPAALRRRQEKARRDNERAGIR